LELRVDSSVKGMSYANFRLRDMNITVNMMRESTNDAFGH